MIFPTRQGQKELSNYCEAIPAMNRTKKNIIKGANEPLRYPGANNSEIINAKINAGEIDMTLFFFESDFAV